MIDSKCKICGRDKPTPPIDFQVQRNLLHDLCWRCNKGLDLVNYDADWFRRAIEYKRRTES